MKLNILTKYPTIEILKLLSNQELTVREIKQRIPDISRTKLYKCIKKMHEENLIKVVRENTVNGLKQKVYTTTKEEGILTAKNLKNASKKDFELFFNTFIYSAINDFQKNLSNLKKEELLNSTSFIKGRFYLTHEEKKQMYKEIKEVIKKYSELKPNENRMEEDFLMMIQQVYKDD